MTSGKFVAVFVAVLALAIMFVSVSTAATNEHVTISDLEVNGVDALGGSVDIGEFSGNTVPVRVQFLADNLPDTVSEDVRVKAWISGSSSNSAVTSRFDVLEDRTYVKTLSVELPSDLDDDELEESYTLTVLIESQDDGRLSEEKVDLTIQRESYDLDILDVDVDSKANIGGTLVVDVVLKNKGRQFAEDTFVVARIPALGVSDKAYFGDLSATDQDDPDKENTNERRLVLNIPGSAPAGIYLVEVEAYNKDSISTETTKVVISGASQNTVVVSPVHSKSFAVGEEQEYSMTLVNRGSTVEVYEFVVDSPASLSVWANEPVVAVSAGTSKTVTFTAEAESEGQKTFTVNVHSGSELVQSETFSANVDGRSGAGNATVILTVILAIIFVVLLVVLIVLLTKKPEEKNEEFGESYY